MEPTKEIRALISRCRKDSLEEEDMKKIIGELEHLLQLKVNYIPQMIKHFKVPKHKLYFPHQLKLGELNEGNFYNDIRQIITEEVYPPKSITMNTIPNIMVGIKKIIKNINSYLD